MIILCLATIIHFVFLTMTLLFFYNKIDLTNFSFVKADAFNIIWWCSGFATLSEIITIIMTSSSFNKSMSWFYIIINIILAILFLASIYYTMNISERGRLWQLNKEIRKLEQRMKEIDRRNDTKKILDELDNTLIKLIEKKNDFLIKSTVDNMRKVSNKYLKES